MSQPLLPRDIEALFGWYRSVGVTEFTAEQATDWFDLERQIATRRQQARTAKSQPMTSPSPRRAAPAPTQRPVGEERMAGRPIAPVTRQPPAATSPPVRRPIAAAAPDQAVMAARAEAKSARSLDELRAILERFEGCGLKATAKSLCLYRGVAQSRVMLIGEAPGRDEDLAGKPFVGRAGQLLDRMLAAIGLDETNIHITNVVYWRPPGNRTPTLQEVQVCEPFLRRQIELVAPEIIVLLGGAAAKQLLDSAEGIMRLRGKWRSIEAGGKAVKAIATLHPAYLLRTPNAKKQAWRDLLMIEAALASKES
jgi:DNA polymerase